MNKAQRFTNWTKEDFSHKWDSVQYTFKAGESEMVQDYLAHHFAKHLAQREINKKNLPMTSPKFKEFYFKCLNDESISAESELKLEMEIEKVNNKKEVKKEEKKEEVKEVKKATKSPKKEEDSFQGK